MNVEPAAVRCAGRPGCETPFRKGRARTERNEPSEHISAAKSLHLDLPPSRILDRIDRVFEFVFVARVCCVKRFLEMGDRLIDVDLRGRDVRMAEQPL
jgi:hypothetical protein